ncbi:MAG: NAD(P)-binding domain-containing protein [Casimicrobiaceae bacterium]
MDIGFIGLSGDSERVARQAARAGVNVFGFDASGRAAALADEKVLVALPDAVALARALSAPRVVWMNVRPGKETELAIQDVWPELAAGDVIIDAAGARYKDAARREDALATAKIHFVDCMVAPPEGDDDDGLVLYFGGNSAAAQVFAPMAEVLAPGGGWLHFGPAGSGHYLRMRIDIVQAEIESGLKMMQPGNQAGNARLERLRESYGKDANQ